ncbi:MAG: protein kinase domain-containing protein [Parvularcula sp.]
MNDYQRIERAFHQAIHLQADEREEFIRSFEKSHPTLGPKLRHLIAADDCSDDSFVDPIAGSVSKLVERDSDQWIGRRVGVWQIVQPLGAGGMGMVFLAKRQDKEFEQVAALKIMTAQLANADAGVRFRIERQILANLNHPNIATLLDGGTTEENLPYLVMEYVQGVRIDRYCDDQNLSLKDRLRLFQKVCEGVDHAHRNLIVHRDLKPSNILVTEEGEPKLLDFGIAEILDDKKGNDEPMQPVKGAPLMTPEYASPEQIRGEPISIATDVYTLGVLLFRILTGRSPYSPTTADAKSLVTAILETEPQPPSSKVSLPIADPAASNAKSEESQIAQSPPPHALRKTLSGDLDSIVLKCLQKAPDGRYRTSKEISADIENYLTGRPVFAREGSWFYSVQKWAERNAQLFYGTLFLVVIIVSLVAFYTIRLSQERDRATLAAAEAEQVATFLSETFASASPAVSQGEPVTVLDLIRSARKNIEALEDQDKLQGRLLFVMAESYYWLGQDQDAAELYESSLKHFQNVDPQPMSDIIESLIALGDTQARLGQNDESFETLKRGLELSSAELGPRSSKTLWFETLIASNHLRLRHTDEALRILESARTKFESSPDQEEELELFLLTDLATALDRASRVDEALTVMKAVIERSEEIKGAYHPNTIVRIYNYSLSLRRQWRLVEASDQMQVAIDRGAQTWGPADPTRRSHMTGYAINLEMLGRFADAKPLREESMALAGEIDGKNSQSYLRGQLGVAIWNKDRGNLAQAASQFKDILAPSRHIQDRSVFYATLTRLFLGQTYNEMGDYSSALQVTSQALSDREVLSTSLDQTLSMQHALALLGTGQAAEATLVVDELVRVRDKDGNQQGAKTVSMFTDFAKFYRRAGSLEKSEAYARRAYLEGQNGLPTGNWYTALAASELALTLAAQGRPVDAQPIAEEARTALVETFGPADYRVRRLNHLAQK